MTDQEKEFIEELVFQYFNDTEVTQYDHALAAVKKAGYKESISIKYKQIIDELLKREDIQTEIKKQKQLILEKFSGEQRRNLWKAIVNMEIGEPCELEGRIQLRY
ncbi:MAG: hypothetical protein IJ188_08965 [Clostridia bacterium]|nr:hypothetical protein [Clostridia bacterium]